MKLQKRLDSEADRQFWALLDQIVAEVNSWPVWKQGRRAEAKSNPESSDAGTEEAATARRTTGERMP